MRLPARPGERIDREREVSFTFGGEPVRAFEGDTIGSALYASGRRVFSRSFKYHRPRGLLCCSGNCPNCMMTVDGVPNIRVCAEPVRDGASVRPQNVWGSLERDLLAATDKLGGPFTPVGFYYRTMIRPRWAWPLYEKFLRSVAGLGKLPKHGKRANRYDVEHRRAEVLVIGGGRSGIEAARGHAAKGNHVVLVDEHPDVLEAPLHLALRLDEPRLHATTWPDARRIARSIFGYAPQRQTFPAIASRIRSRSGRSTAVSSAVAETICPGVQKPHCSASSATNASWSAAAVSPSPSIVVTSRPSAAATGSRQEATARPSSSTAHAPHAPSPQPCLAPVKARSSRSTASRRRVGATSTTCSSPFTWSEIGTLQAVQAP